MKTREQIENRIASVEQSIEWLKDDLAKANKKFEDGVHSVSQAKMIEQDVEFATTEIQKRYREIEILKWVLGD